jgi:hypothetical protein
METMAVSVVCLVCDTMMGGEKRWGFVPHARSVGAPIFRTIVFGMSWKMSLHHRLAFWHRLTAGSSGKPSPDRTASDGNS